MQCQGWSDARTSRLRRDGDRTFETEPKQDRLKNITIHHTSSLHGRAYLEPLAREADLYAVVWWFHSSGLQLLAVCRAFTVAGPKVWNVLPDRTSAQSLTIFCQRLKPCFSYSHIRWHHLNCYPSDHLLTVFNPEVALQLRHCNTVIDWLIDWLISDHCVGPYRRYFKLCTNWTISIGAGARSTLGAGQDIFDRKYTYEN